MKRSYKKNANILSVIVTVFMLGCLCEKNTNPTSFMGPLELLQPKGGESFKVGVGESVTIKWSIHDQNQIGSVIIDYSIDGGKIWSVNSITDHSFTYPETIYVWIPTASQISNQFVLKVREYDDRTINDKSDPFTVHQ